MGRRACVAGASAALLGGVAARLLAACAPAADEEPVEQASSAAGVDASRADATREADTPEAGPGEAGPVDAAAADASDASAEAARLVAVHDTFAVALYFDGSLGPKTGTVTARAMAAGDAVPMPFWHGHGGVLHRFVVAPADLAALRAGRKVTIRTTEVDGHSHLLFVDPRDPRWRVPGGETLLVPA